MDVANLGLELRTAVGNLCLTSSEEPLLNEEEIVFLQGDLQSFRISCGYRSSACVAEGQPLALELLQKCLEVIGDVDSALPRLLQRFRQAWSNMGSGVWRPAEVP